MIGKPRRLYENITAQGDMGYNEHNMITYIFIDYSRSLIMILSDSYDYSGRQAGQELLSILK